MFNQSIKQLKDYELQSIDSLSNKSIAESEARKDFWMAHAFSICLSNIKIGHLLNHHLFGCEHFRGSSLAEHCQVLRNFNSMFAVLSGLGHGSLTRLKQTWEKLPAKYLKMFEVNLKHEILSCFSLSLFFQPRCSLTEINAPLLLSINFIVQTLSIAFIMSLIINKRI